MDPKIPILITQAILPSPLAHTRTLLPGGATWQPLLLAALLAALALISTPRLLRLARNEACLRRLPIPPTPSWLLGHLSDFAHPQHHLRLFDWATQLGPVYSLRLLTSRLVVLSDPRAAAAALRLGGGAEKPDVVYHVGNMFNSECGEPNMVSARTASPLWRAVRKGTAPAFSASSLRQGFPELRPVLRALHAVLASHATDGAPLDVADLMLRASFDAVGHLGFHHAYCTVEAYDGPPSMHANAIMRAFEAMMHEVPKRSANPFRRYARWDRSVREADAATRVFQAEMRALLRGLRAADLPPHSLGSLLLSTLDPSTKGPLSEARLLSELSNMFVAGADTTGNTLAWALYLVSLHPGVEARVEEELKGLGLCGPGAKELEVGDLGRLRWLNAVVKETLRIMPVSAEGTAVEFDRDTDILGYRIPAGTLIWIPFFIMHRSSGLWDRPEVFDPERWLTPECEHVEGQPGQALRFCPFSQGTRSCAGQAMAEMNYRAILASIWGRFTFTAVDESLWRRFSDQASYG